MALLIDGFNLIYKFLDLERMMYQNNLYEARRGLLTKLKEYQRITKAKITVIFDGKKDVSLEINKERVQSIDVYYSLDYSADFLIKQFVKKDMNPKMITVVTSDKDIIDYVMRFKSKVKTSEEFYKHYTEIIQSYLDSLEPDKDVNLNLSKEEISYWEEQFKIK